MQRWKITIEYDGTSFFGWQRQAGDARTVQGIIEASLKKFTNQNITLHVAGRTDAGVHAHGQVAHFDVDDTTLKMMPFQMTRAINAFLVDEGVVIVHAEKVDPDFHARFHAKNKHYRYRVQVRSPQLVHERTHLWHRYKPLDLEAMRKGAAYLVGHHDFTSFRATECQAKSPFRTLDRLDISEQKTGPYSGTEFIFDIEGRSFLHHQVRNMVGTLVMVGEGKWMPENVAEALAAKDRAAGGQTAPSSGLSLMRVDY